MIIRVINAKNPKYFGLNRFLCTITNRKRTAVKAIAPLLEYVDSIAIELMRNKTAIKVFSKTLRVMKNQ